MNYGHQVILTTYDEGPKLFPLQCQMSVVQGNNTENGSIF